MIYTELTKKAMKIAFRAHRDQVDKTGLPYVFHPFHLAEQMPDEYTACAALLHDVAEDTDITLEQLAAQGFPEPVMTALRLLTHDPAVPYMDYVRAIRPNPIARLVKLADLRHNSDLSRLDTMDDWALKRQEKYLAALALLEAPAESGSLRLVPVRGSNIREILALQVAEHQRCFVATNQKSINDAYTVMAVGGHVWPFGIYDGDTPVGFLMLSHGVDPDWTDAPAIAHGTYFLWRFMIDQRYQGRGYGKQALGLALDFIKTCPRGRSKLWWTAWHPENAVAAKLYRSFGFRETGEKDGKEIIAALEL